VVVGLLYAAGAVFFWNDGALLVAALELRDHPHVVLQGQQRDQGATDHVHVLGDQHPDHTSSSRPLRTVSESGSPAA
jgi:hypothetical protein